jgi:hypothetical protein
LPVYVQTAAAESEMPPRIKKRYGDLIGVFHQSGMNESLARERIPSDLVHLLLLAGGFDVAGAPAVWSPVVFLVMVIVVVLPD